MSPVTPRCAKPVTDPRSTPGGVLPRESRRRGFIPMQGRLDWLQQPAHTRNQVGSIPTPATIIPCRRLPTVNLPGRA
jgi:hypothetical protein